MTWDAGRERLERDRLLARLLDLGIDAPVVRYPAHTSIEEGKRLRGTLPGTFTKNLLLKDKKGRLFFVTAFEDTDVDLKSLHTRIGAQGRLGFASPDANVSAPTEPMAHESPKRSATTPAERAPTA